MAVKIIPSYTAKSGAKWYSNADRLNAYRIATSMHRRDPNLPNIFVLDPKSVSPKGIENKKGVVFIVKADVGGVGGHNRVAEEAKSGVAEVLLEESNGMLTSFYVVGQGDDVAITGTTFIDPNAKELHQLFWNAFEQGGVPAVELTAGYGKGQDLVDKSRVEVSGNVQGAGPGFAYLVCPDEIRDSLGAIQATAVYADKAGPDAYNGPLFDGYGVPFMGHNAWMFSNAVANGYLFAVQHIEAENLVRDLIKAGMDPQEAEKRASDEHRIIYLTNKTLKEQIALGVLLGNTVDFAVRNIYALNNDGSIRAMAAAVSTDKLHNIINPKTGQREYLGKDDPVWLSFVNKIWPAPGEILATFAKNWIVAGDCRGSHHTILIPKPLNATSTYFSGGLVSAAEVSIRYDKEGNFYIGELTDAFELGDPVWDYVRAEGAKKYEGLRKNGFVHPATLEQSTLEYQTLIQAIKPALDSEGGWRFVPDMGDEVKKLLAKMKVEDLGVDKVVSRLKDIK